MIDLDQKNDSKIENQIDKYEEVKEPKELTEKPSSLTEEKLSSLTEEKPIPSIRQEIAERSDWLPPIRDFAMIQPIV